MLLEAVRDFNGPLSSGFSVCVNISRKELWVRLQVRDTQGGRQTNRSDSVIYGFSCKEGFPHQSHINTCSVFR